MIPANVPKYINRLLLLAIRAPDRLVDRAAPDLAGKPTLIAWRAYCLGLAYLRLQQLEPMHAALNQAQQAFNALGDSFGLWHCRGLQLAGVWLSGADAASIASLEQLAQDFDQHNYVLEAARTRMLQALHCYSLGDAEQALRLMQSIALIIKQSPYQEDQAFWLWISGIAYTHNDDFSQAAELFDQAYAMFCQLGMQPDTGRCLFDRSWLFQRQERYHDALTDLAQANAIAHRLEMVYLLAACYKNTGLALSRLGCYADGLAATLEARSYYVRLARHDLINGCDLNLAIITYYSGLYELALNMFQRAEVIYRSLNRIRMATACLRNQALALRAQHNPQAAYLLLRQIEPSILQGNDQFEQAEYWQALAFALADLDDLAQAVSMFDQAEQLFHALDNQPAIAKCRLEVAWLRLRQLSDPPHDLMVLRQLKRQLQETFEHLGDRPFYRWRIYYGIGLCEAKIGQNQAALQAYIQASITVANLRLEFLDEHASSAVFLQSRDLFTTALDLALQTNDSIAVLLLTEQQRALVLRQYLKQHEHRSDYSDRQIPRVLQLQLWRILRSQAVDLLTDLPRPSGFSASRAKLDLLAGVNAPDLVRLRATLTVAYPAGWAIVSYIRYQTSLVRLLLTPTELEATTILLDAALEKLIQRASLARYRWLTYGGIQINQHQAWPELELLSQHLLPPMFAQKLHPAMRLFIAPAETLHGLAWGALRLDGHWLCQQTVINIIPNLSLGKADNPPTKAPGVIIACSQFHQDVRPLPKVATEIDLIGAIYEEMQPLTLHNAAVTKAQICVLSDAGALAGCRFLHIASHARMRPGAEQVAYIQLWDEILTFDEIIDLQLQGTVVILSVCDGSASEVLAGEEVLSLSRACLAAGAIAVIANLWQQDDDTSPALMAHLHSLLYMGIDPIEALSRLQNSCITNPQQMSPLVWGGFQVISSLEYERGFLSNLVGGTTSHKGC